MNGYKPIEREVKPRFKVGDEVILTNDFGEEKLVKVTKVEEYNSKAYMYWIGETWFGDGQNARLVQTEEEMVGIETKGWHECDSFWVEALADAVRDGLTIRYELRGEVVDWLKSLKQRIWNDYD